MKKLIAGCVLLSSFLSIKAQNYHIDSLQKVLKRTPKDATHVFTLLHISNAYYYSQPDSGMRYAQQAYEVAKEIHLTLGEAQSLSFIGDLLYEMGDYVKALETQIKALEIYEKRKDTSGVAARYNSMALIYQELEDYHHATEYYLRAKDIFEAKKQKDDELVKNYINIGNNYEKMDSLDPALLDSALFYLNKAYELSLQIHDKEDFAVIHVNLGNIHYKLKNNDTALSHYRISIPFALQVNDKQSLANAKYGIAKIFKETGKIDSSILFSKESLASSRDCSFPKGIEKASTLLSKLYETQKNKIDSAFKYHKVSMAIKDSLFNAAKRVKMQYFTYNERQREKEKAAQQQYRNKLRIYALIGGFIILLLVAASLLHINQLKREHLIKTNLSKDLHDDLGSTLNSIKVYTNLALIKKEEQHLQHIKESTQEAINGVRDIMWVMDDRKNIVENLLTRLRQFAIPLLEANDIHYIQQVNDEASRYKLGQQEKKNLFLIVKEAINNTIKYAKANEVNVTISMTNKRKLFIQIKDTGQGFDLVQANDGNGLKNMKFRAEQIDYHFTINSVINQGTVIELKKH